MTVLIVDYGMGNLASARRALEECGASVRVSDRPEDVKDAERIVIPGVGAFAHAMERLRSRGWVEAIRDAALTDEIPVLGVCLGMQLLADEGDEGGDSRGLGLVRGRVERLVPAAEGERVPHVGWNEVNAAGDPALLAGIPAATDFYFVHSYRFVPEDEADIVATTPYCGGLVSAVGRGRIAGVQFHPEKSSRAGFRLLRNFLAL